MYNIQLYKKGLIKATTRFVNDDVLLTLGITKISDKAIKSELKKKD